jgi:putative flippase GtrA
MVAYQQGKPKKRPQFYGYFSILVYLTIIVAAALWLVYDHLPPQDYLPISFVVIAITGFVAFFILDRKVKL